MSDLPVIDAQPPKPVVDAPVLAPGDSAVADQNRDPETGGEVEKTPEQEAAEAEAKEIDKLRKELERTKRKLNTVHGQRQEARERARYLEQQINLRQSTIDDTNHASADDSDVVSIPRSRFDEVVEQRARQRAQTIRDEMDLETRRSTVARTLRDEIGPEKWQELTDELADFLPDPDAQLLILESDAPKALIEYLTDPENEAEAKAFRRLSPYQQGMKLGQLSAQLKAKRNRDKPIPSKAPQPLEPVKAQGNVSRKPLALLDGKEFAERRRQQIAARFSR